MEQATAQSLYWQDGYDRSLLGQRSRRQLEKSQAAVNQISVPRDQ
jgi:hypothetical protein